MNPQQQTQPTAGAMRAVRAIHNKRNTCLTKEGVEEDAKIIDRETHIVELTEAAQAAFDYLSMRNLGENAKLIEHNLRIVLSKTKNKS